MTCQYSKFPFVSLIWEKIHLWMERLKWLFSLSVWVLILIRAAGFFFPFHSSISKEKEQLREKLELLPGQMGLTGSA